MTRPYTWHKPVTMDIRLIRRIKHMKQMTTDSGKRFDTFFIFRFLYNSRLKNVDDCTEAFEQARMIFFLDHGICPYDELEDYLQDLFEVNNGFQQLFN